MVNYCCVYGCGRNNKTSKHLYYYSLPKERHRYLSWITPLELLLDSNPDQWVVLADANRERSIPGSKAYTRHIGTLPPTSKHRAPENLVQWLEAVGRVDLLEKDLKKLTHRVCSRHFSPSSIKNKHLCADAVPTLCLSSDSNEVTNESEKQQSSHSNIICNSCNKTIFGVRYKCVTCDDYDLCSKCEMLEAHDQHYMLRIPKLVNFTEAEDLIKKWRQLHKKNSRRANHECSSDDDVPITKYFRSDDSGIDLTEEEKTKIRDEVTRVINMKPLDEREEELNKRKQKLQKKKGIPKKKKVIDSVDMCVDTLELESMAPEVVFADVNDIKGNQNFEVKDELENTLTPLVSVQQIEHSMKLNDELSEFLIGVKYSDG